MDKNVKQYASGSSLPNIDKPEGLDRESASEQPLQKINFILIGVCLFMIVLGFLLMTGSPSTQEAFNPDIFSTRRIVVGPTIAFLGFVAMGCAIMYSPKKRK